MSDNIQTKTVTDQYGNEYVHHINRNTGGTVHKHAKDVSHMCPYCQPDMEYGLGVEYEGDHTPDIPGL